VFGSFRQTQVEHNAGRVKIENAQKRDRSTSSVAANNYCSQTLV